MQSHFKKRGEIGNLMDCGFHHAESAIAETEF